MLKILQLLLIICLPLMFYINVGTKINVSIADFILPFLVLILIFKKKKNIDSKEMNFVIYSFLIIFSMLLSLLVASYSDNLKDEISGISNVIKVIINFFYAFVVYNFLNADKNYESFFLKTWSITATVFSLLGLAGIFLYLIGLESMLTLEYRLNSTLNDPNLAALYLITSFIFNQVYCYKYLNKTININSVIILTALLLTVSRGGIIGFSLAIIITLLISLPYLNIKRIICIFLFLSILVLFISYAGIIFNNHLINIVLERIQSLDTDESSIKHRIILWKTAIEIWVNNPIIGVGTGQFSSEASKYLGYKMTDIPHNTYFGFLAEIGTLGFLTFIWMPAYLIIKLKVKIKNKNVIIVYLFIGLLSISIQAFTINIENVRFFWIYLVYIHYWVTEKRSN